MITGYIHTTTDRFLRYVQVDTQSDPASQTNPTSAKQKNLSAILAEELHAMGAMDAHADEWGYVYATIPSNSEKQVPVICFCSHIDTAPDCSGTGVKPKLHQNYDGSVIILPDDAGQVISPEKYPYLLTHTGNDIITASGTTLLGADDKAGVAIIMDMAHYLLSHPEILHGTIRILFTPDEEVGKGTAKLDMQKLAADFGYTLDGGEAGCFEDETFSADGARVTVQGVIAHPGDAKGKMINALKIISEIIAALPKDKLSPESTGGREGFIHPVKIEGIAEKAHADFIIRDFDTAELKQHESVLNGVAAVVLANYPRASYTLDVWEQYRNMKEVLNLHPQVAEYAAEAYTNCGLSLVNEPIRGGTDGSKLSFMGLPCANIFTGMQAIHSLHEWVGVKDMNKAVQVLAELVQVWERKS